jgi:hypothetical protein
VPKVDPLIPDDIVLTRFEELSPLLRLIPQQVGMVTALTIGQLEDYRKAGKPPRFTNDGGPVRYFVGDVRDYLLSMRRYTSTREARTAKDAMVAGLGFSSLRDFLDYGKPEDQWPIAIVGGRYVDFFDSLSMGLSDEDTAEWMSLCEYLVATAGESI